MLGELIIVIQKFASQFVILTLIFCNLKLNPDVPCVTLHCVMHSLSELCVELKKLLESGCL